MEYTFAVWDPSYRRRGTLAKNRCRSCSKRGACRSLSRNIVHLLLQCRFERAVEILTDLFV